MPPMIDGIAVNMLVIRKHAVIMVINSRSRDFDLFLQSVLFDN